MERGERIFINQARQADVKQSGPETHVFSQVIDLVEQLNEDEAFTVHFGTDREAMQTVLDGLGVGKIVDPTNTIVRLDQFGGVSHPTYGTDTIGKLKSLFEKLPASESVRMVQAASWSTSRDSYELDTPDVSTSRIFYRSSPKSNLIIALQCRVTYTPNFPEWDEMHPYYILKSQVNHEKMELVGDYLLSDNENDRPSFPEQHFAFSVLKTSQLKDVLLSPLFPLPIDIHVSKSIANTRYENGMLVPIPDTYAE